MVMMLLGHQLSLTGMRVEFMQETRDRPAGMEFIGPPLYPRRVAEQTSSWVRNVCRILSSSPRLNRRVTELQMLNPVRSSAGFAPSVASDAIQSIKIYRGIVFNIYNQQAQQLRLYWQKSRASPIFAAGAAKPRAPSLSIASDI